MKVLHVGTKTWPPRHGGVEKIVYDLVSAAGAVESWVLADACEREEGRVGQLAAGLLPAWRQVRSLVRREGLDLVHLHKETSIPLALLLRLSGLRCVLTLHGLAWRLARWSLMQRAALWILDLAACLTMSAVIFVGERDHRCYRRWLPDRRLHLVPNGVEVPEASATAGAGWVYLGRISPEKNVNALIDAALAAGIPLDLHGPLDERDAAFAARFRELAGQPGVRWHGPLAFEQVPAMLARHRVLANPSFSEGMPVSVLEAAAQGLFLVLSDIPQHRLLAFPETCYVDPAAIDLTSIPANPAGGEGNREHARRHFARERMVTRTHRVYGLALRRAAGGK